MSERHDIEAILFDRDGTLIEDVPYNRDPDQVHPLPTAQEALDLARSQGIRVGVVSNQSGIGRGLLTPDEVQRINDRVNELLGPFDVWRICPHTPDDGCDCRKPQPRMILSAIEELQVPPDRAAMIGDIGADLEAAESAGVRGMLVPTTNTQVEEVLAAPRVARNLLHAVQLMLAHPRGASA